MPDEPPQEYAEHICDVRLGVDDCAQIAAWLGEFQPVSISTGHDTEHPSIAALAGAVATDRSLDHVHFSSADHARQDAITVMLFNDPFAVLVAIHHPSAPALAIAARISALCRTRAIASDLAHIRGPLIEMDPARLTSVSPDAAAPSAETAASAPEPESTPAPEPSRLARLAMGLSGTALTFGVAVFLQLRSCHEHSPPTEEPPPAVEQPTTSPDAAPPAPATTDPDVSAPASAPHQ